MADRITAKKGRRANPRAEKRTYEDGRVAALDWLKETHPSGVRELLRFIGWWMARSLRAPWDDCPLPQLRQALALNGRLYAFGFFDGVRKEYQSLVPALGYLRHHEGVQDGRRWALDFATEGQLFRLKVFSTGSEHLEVFTGQYREDPWTPAHQLVAFLLNENYPTDAEGEPYIDCTEFRDFWQPFVKEPMADLVRSFHRIDCHGRHKLQDCHFVTGFVDGALGLSDRLGKHLSEWTMTLPTNDEYGRND